VIGFHGSAIENWYSIVNYGLDVKYSADANLFGEGIYLSSNSKVAMNFLKPGATWKLSRLGSNIGCLLACEVVKHPEVKFNEQPSHTFALDNTALPKDYILAKNNHHVQAKYLLVYKHENVTHRGSRWFIILIFYLALLFFISIVRSNKFQRAVANYFKPQYTYV